MSKGSVGLNCNLALRSGITVKYADLTFYTVNVCDDTVTVRLDAYIDKAAALAGKSALDIMTSDDINTQFTYDQAALAVSSGFPAGILTHIIAVESVFAASTQA